MNPNNSSYEHYYNITFLDDLHNYFPEILYGERNRFRTLYDLLEYIRFESRNRFDLYSSARRRHHRSRRNLTSPSQAAEPRREPETISISLTTEDIQHPQIRTQPLNETADLASSVLGLLNLVYPSGSRSFMEPVVVRPTEEQITSATSIVEVPNNTENCTICQQSMNTSEQIRRINGCRHTFHDSCIRTHFRTNVRCPNCRHDIRTSTNESRA